MNENQTMHRHFSQVASAYRQIRTTDMEPIQFIADTLKDRVQIKAADVGCGEGRYDLLLFQHLNRLHLTCIDVNQSMLKQVTDYLTQNDISDFKTITADGKDFPLEDNSMDCIFTFNAIHHFDFVRFIGNSGRVINSNGKIFIYTRLRSQNARNIWGRYFPLFSAKEDRLYELDELEKYIHSVRSVKLESTQVFKYKRRSNLEQLIEKVKARHYSTFSLYGENELAESLEEFQKNLNAIFLDMNEIEWVDENILLVLNKK